MSDDDVLTPEQFAQNKDPYNGPVTGLVALAVTGLVLGVIFLIIGIIGSTEYSGFESVHVVKGWAVGLGSALIGLGVQIFILLCLFWAWRHERRSLARAAELR